MAIFVLEGSIGAGKTTLLEEIGRHAKDIKIVGEPQKAWSLEVDGESLLANFYADPRRWFYTMDMTTMIRRVQDHMEFQKRSEVGEIVLVERSIYSGYFCYATYGRIKGFMSAVEWAAYSQWAEYAMSKLCRPPTGFIYLRAPAGVCLQRIRKRQRHGEEKISLEYLEETGKLHDNLLLTRKTVPEEIRSQPVLVLDGTKELGSPGYDRMVSLAVNFMRRLGRQQGAAVVEREERLSPEPSSLWYRLHKVFIGKMRDSHSEV